MTAKRRRTIGCVASATAKVRGWRPRPAGKERKADQPFDRAERMGSLEEGHRLRTQVSLYPERKGRSTSRTLSRRYISPIPAQIFSPKSYFCLLYLFTHIRAET